MERIDAGAIIRRAVYLLDADSSLEKSLLMPINHDVQISVFYKSQVLISNTVELQFPACIGNSLISR
jgi:hypothetical protein